MSGRVMRIANALLFACFALSPTSCAPSRKKIDLDDGLRDTRAGHYTLVIVTDAHFVSFQNSRAKDEYDFVGDLPMETVVLLKAAVADAVAAGHEGKFVDIRPEPDPKDSPGPSERPH